MADKFALILITLWVGAIWSIGALAAPTLFYFTPDRQLAGALAGHMFTFVAYIGMVSGGYLLLHRLVRVGMSAFKQRFFWSVFVMLLLTLIGHFGIQPIIAELKAQALPADVMESVFASRFKAWHGIASVAYVVEGLLGFILVLRQK